MRYNTLHIEHGIFQHNQPIAAIRKHIIMKSWEGKSITGHRNGLDSMISFGNYNLDALGRALSRRPMNLICHVINQNPDSYLEQLRRNALAEGDGCVANAIITNERNEILVLRRSQNRSLLPFCWDLPGGHIEKNETLEQGLYREVIEEIGIPLRSIDALIAHWAWRSAKDPHRNLQQFDFLATLEPGHPIHLNLDEFVESRWLASNELWLFQEYRAANDVAMRDVLRHAFNLKGTPT